MKQDNKKGRLQGIMRSSWWGIPAIILLLATAFITNFWDGLDVNPTAAKWLCWIAIGVTIVLCIPAILREINGDDDDDLNIKTRYPDGCCQACGYDLTGNTSGFCPECGSRVLPKDLAERARRADAVQAHYLGDKVGIVVFGAIGIGGLLCGLFCTDELQMLGFVLAWSGGVGVAFMIVHIIWLRRLRVPLKNAKQTVAKGRKQGQGQNTRGD